MNRSGLERLAPLTGILFVALYVASFIVLADTPNIDDSTDEVVSFWKDNTDESVFSAALVLWGSVLAVWFAGSLRSVLRRAEGEPSRLTAIAFGGWIMFAVGGCAFAGLNFALGDAADESAVPAETIQTLSVLSEDFFPILTAGLALAMLGTGVATLRFGGLPRWLGYVALVIGIAALTPVGFFGFMVSGLWVIVVSVLLYRQGSQAPASPTPASGV